MGIRRIAAAGIVLLLGWSGGVASAQVTEERLQTVEEEVGRLHTENEALRERVRALEEGSGNGSPAAAPAEAPAGPAVRYEWPAGQRGLTIAGDGYRIRLGSFIQVHGRVYDPGHPAANDFIVRRARLQIEATFADIFTLDLVGRWDRGRAALHYAWVELAPWPVLRLRAGQFKEPFGAEQLDADTYIDFLERGIGSSNSGPVEDVGVMLHGRSAEIALAWAIGAFNGRPINQNETSDDKDVAARLVFSPTIAGTGLDLSVAATYGRVVEDLAGTGFVTAGETRFFEFAAGTDVSRERTRLNAAAQWFAGPFAASVEWILADLERVEGATASVRDRFESIAASAAFIVTLEDQPRNAPLVPTSPFNPAAGAWGPGAVEIAVRFEQWRGGEHLLNQGLATGTDRVRAITVGLDWWPDGHVRVGFDYVRSVFEDPVIVGGKTLDDEDLFILRFQMEM